MKGIVIINKMLTVDISNLLFNIAGKLKGHYALRTFADDSILFRQVYLSNNIRNQTFRRLDYISLSETSIHNMYFYIWMNNMGYFSDIPELQKRVYRNCITDGNLKIAKMMTPYLDVAMRAAIESNNIHRIKWVYKNITTKLDYLTYLKDHDNLEIVQWLYEKYPTLDFIEQALETDSLEYVKWYCNICQDCKGLIYKAIIANKFKTFLWLYENYNGESFIDEIIAFKCSVDVNCGDLEIIVWLTANFKDKVLAQLFRIS